ncbi:hypothetical protein BD410DRAFT_148726 [Rickenella mellea]|uniref:Uncharacterized protein n=1 Tax=Rickenella mellea TaxID=50990 RepID=A0A4Y7Q8X3_9AGAM|nr:hypothetical protein BD410DRAFT_148726 [Rickenella mellea]
MPRLSQIRVATLALDVRAYGMIDYLASFNLAQLLVRPSSISISDICFQCQHQRQRMVSRGSTLRRRSWTSGANLGPGTRKLFRILLSNPGWCHNTQPEI